MITRETYEELLTRGDMTCVHQNINLMEIRRVHICSGTFNPLHDMHRLIYASALEYSGQEHVEPDTIGVAYELALTRRDKGTLSYDDFMEIVSQFYGLPLIMTACNTFVKKVGLLHQIGVHDVTCHIGYDTAKRLLEDDTHFGVAGIGASFVVYSRDNLGLNELPSNPYNMYEGSYSGGEYIGGVSSTKIRERNGNV